MINAATKAGEYLKQEFEAFEELEILQKGPADFVSQADLKAEDLIKESLALFDRDITFLAEESGKFGGNMQNRWIIDPIDGTTNFLHGIPHWSISIAYEEKGILSAGVVYNPTQDEMYYAWSGHGSYLNDRPIHVSRRTELNTCLFATGIPFKGCTGIDVFNKRLAATTMACSGTRRFGSAALDCAWLATGRYDAYWEGYINIWDVAAGIVLVQEAGGRVTDIHGDPIDSTYQSQSILASNNLIHTEVADLISGATDKSESCTSIS